jgi:hypothetical protein
MLPETIKTRGLHVGVRFAPPALLDKLHKRQFQLKCSEGFDWRRQEFLDQAWHLVTPQAEGDPRSQLKLSLQPDVVSFEDFFPTGPLDVFCDNLRLSLNSFAEVFSPRLILNSGVVVRLTAESEGQDARVFLGRRCLRLEDRLSPLGRPVHAVGFKLLLPPLPGENNPNWHADVKVESLVEDPRQLFIEVDARWGTPVQWDLDQLVDRIHIVHHFATHQVVAVLHEMSRDE